MEVLIGVDEAGYGPNYGPLVVAATAWRVDAKGEGGRGKAEGRRRRTRDVVSKAERAVTSPTTAIARPQAMGSSAMPDLYRLLKKGVVRDPVKCARRVAIADSKALYKPGLGLRQLERGVLAALALLQWECATVLELIGRLGADPECRRRELPCHHGDHDGLPTELTAEELAEGAALLGAACLKNGVTLVSIRARLVYPAEFNALVDQFGTKGAALSHVTLALVRQLTDALPTAHRPLPTRIFFDKHGGRSRYAALLQHHFPECWIEPVAESRAESRYQWEHRGGPVAAAFRVGCEEFLPTALASMTAKYKRELAMRAFNAFWTARVPGLRPTAGYPGDSRRFRSAIAAVQAELGFADRDLWRQR
jgi:hypothetical protein